MIWERQVGLESPTDRVTLSCVPNHSPFSLWAKVYEEKASHWVFPGPLESQGVSIQHTTAVYLSRWRGTHTGRWSLPPDSMSLQEMDENGETQSDGGIGIGVEEIEESPSW